MLELAAPIALCVFLIMGTGAQHTRFIPYHSLEDCFEAAWQLMQHSPREFGAAAMGAGCVVTPGLRPS